MQGADTPKPDQDIPEELEDEDLLEELMELETISKQGTDWVISLGQKFPDCALDEEEGKRLVVFYEEIPSRVADLWARMDSDQKDRYTRNASLVENTLLTTALNKNGILETDFQSRDLTINDFYLAMLLAEYGSEDVKFPLAFLFGNIGQKIVLSELHHEILEQLFFNRSPETRRIAYKYIVRVSLGERDNEKRLEYMVESILMTMRAQKGDVSGSVFDRFGKLFAKMLLETLVVDEMLDGALQEKHIKRIREYIHFFKRWGGQKELEVGVMLADAAQHYFLEKAFEVFGQDYTESVVSENVGDEQFEALATMLEKLHKSENLVDEADLMMNHYLVRWASYKEAIALAQSSGRKEKENGKKIMAAVLEVADKDEILVKFRYPIEGSGEPYTAIATRDDRKAIIKDMLIDVTDEKDLQPSDEQMISLTIKDNDALRFWFNKYTLKTDPEMTEVLVEIFLERDPALFIAGTRIFAKALSHHPDAEGVMRRVFQQSFTEEKDFQRALLKFQYQVLYRQMDHERKTIFVKVALDHFRQFSEAWVDAFLPDAVKERYRAAKLHQKRVQEKAGERKEIQRIVDVEFLKHLAGKVDGSLPEVEERKRDSATVLGRMHERKVHEMAEGDKYQKGIRSETGTAAADGEETETVLAALFQKLSIRKVRTVDPSKVSQALEYQWFLTGSDETEQEKILYTVQGRLDEMGTCSIEIMFKGRAIAVIAEDTLHGLPQEFFEEIRHIIIASLYEYYKEQEPLKSDDERSDDNEEPDGIQEPESDINPDQDADPEQPESSPSVTEIDTVEPRTLLPSKAAPYATIDLTNGRNSPAKRVERRKLHENQERALEIFTALGTPREEDELERIFVYRRERLSGRDVYLPDDTKEVWQQARTGERTLADIFVRKGVAHSKGLGFHMKEILWENDAVQKRSWIVPTKKHPTEIARDVHEQLVQSGAISPLNMDAFEGCTIIRLDTDADAIGLFSAATEFFDEKNYPEIRFMEKEFEWQCREAREMLWELMQEGGLTLEQFSEELKSTYMALKSEFQGKIEKMKVRAELARTRLRSDGKYTTLAQPGKFLFEKTFNQGQFISLEKFLEERAIRETVE